uniref:Uncharacterized protein n=1 Tax=Pipistrellus kuhlii TaxID=59472 RepID=A0A7J7W3U9_PIPKU|nr:hypothetical protein mPipKuh1_008176 [Pipistrellus kuhlii]
MAAEERKPSTCVSQAPHPLMVKLYLFIFLRCFTEPVSCTFFIPLIINIFVHVIIIYCSGQFISVVRVSACGLKGHRFNSLLVAGWIPSPGQSACRKQPIDMSHIDVSFSPVAPPPSSPHTLSLKKKKKKKKKKNPRVRIKKKNTSILF